MNDNKLLVLGVIGVATLVAQKHVAEVRNTELKCAIQAKIKGTVLDLHRRKPRRATLMNVQV